jgi:hypothetical protein
VTEIRQLHPGTFLANFLLHYWMSLVRQEVLELRRRSKIDQKWQQCLEHFVPCHSVTVTSNQHEARRFIAVHNNLLLDPILNQRKPAITMYAISLMNILELSSHPPICVMVFQCISFLQVFQLKSSLHSSYCMRRPCQSLRFDFPNNIW